MKNDGGFEGNAQTLRILCKLEKKSSYYDGLNLTKAALYPLSNMAFITHFKNKSKNKNFFIKKISRI
jgi:dGTPase